MVRVLKYKQGQLTISKSFLRFVVITIMLSGAIAWAATAIPEGATVLVGRTQTRTSPTPQNVTADAGNVTEVNITANSQTQAWQGFFGDVNGSLVLEDASGDTFYSWNLTNVSGEIYTSRDSAISFNLINPQNNCSRDNELTEFGRSDSVNNTYRNNSNTPALAVGTITINTSTACATTTYISSAPQANFFHSVILTDDCFPSPCNSTIGGNTSVYATPIEPERTGFDGITYDYQVLVPVNRTAGFNTYFFYAELG